MLVAWCPRHALTVPGDEALVICLSANLYHGVSWVTATEPRQSVLYHSGIYLGKGTALRSRPAEELGPWGAWFCCQRVSCPVGCARSRHLCRESDETGGQVMWDGATVGFSQGPLALAVPGEALMTQRKPG